METVISISNFNVYIVYKKIVCLLSCSRSISIANILETIWGPVPTTQVNAIHIETGIVELNTRNDRSTRIFLPIYTHAFLLHGFFVVVSLLKKCVCILFRFLELIQRLCVDTIDSYIFLSKHPRNKPTRTSSEIVTQRVCVFVLQMEFFPQFGLFSNHLIYYSAPLAALFVRFSWDFMYV